MSTEIHQGIGAAWLELAAELEQRLRTADPSAAVEPALDVSGLLVLHVKTVRAQRASARALARTYEERARQMCESCGGRVSAAGAGPVVTVLCPSCTSGA